MHLKLAHLSFRNPSDSQDFLWKDICLDVESLEDSGDLSTFVAVDEEIIRANAANSASSRILAIRGPSGMWAPCRRYPAVDIRKLQN